MQNQYLTSIVGSILIDNIYNSLLFHALGIVKLRDYLKVFLQIFQPITAQLVNVDWCAVLWMDNIFNSISV